MARGLSGKAYGKRLIWHTIAVFAVMVGFPFTIFMAGCLWSGDWTVPDRAEVVETARLSTGTGLAAAAYILSIIVFIWPTWCRMRTLGLSAYTSLFIFILFLIDVPFFLSRDEKHIVGSSVSSLSEYPFFLLSAFSITVAMAFAEPPMQTERAFRRFGYAGVGVAATVSVLIVGFVLLIAAAKGIDVIKYRVEHGHDFSTTLMKFIVNVYWFLWLGPFVCFVMMMSLI